jgi:hypothetical protein
VVPADSADLHVSKFVARWTRVKDWVPDLRGVLGLGWIRLGSSTPNSSFTNSISAGYDMVGVLVVLGNSSLERSAFPSFISKGRWNHSCSSLLAPRVRVTAARLNDEK